MKRTLEIGKKFEPLSRSSSPPSTEQEVRLTDSMTGSSWAERWAARKERRKQFFHCALDNILTDDHRRNKPLTYSIQWAVRQPEELALGPEEPQGALEGDVCEKLAGLACSSSQRLFLLSSAQCQSSGASGCRHSQFYNRAASRAEIISYNITHSLD